MQHLSNKREFNRVYFPELARGTITLETTPFQNETQSTSAEAIYIIDMSAGGLRFVSKTDYKVNYLTIYKINMKINNRELIMFGKIIRKSNLINQFKEYGVKFNFNYEPL